MSAASATWDLVSVYDADTIHVEGLVSYLVEQDYRGLTMSAAVVVREKVRLAHCNAPELATPAGRAARARVVEWLEGEAIEMIGLGRDKWGRWLADVKRLSDGALLSAFVLTLPGSVPLELRKQLTVDPLGWFTVV